MDDILKKIIQIPFNDYIKSQHDKSQIILHHTVSGGSAKAVATYWDSRPSRIATCIIIDKKGIPHQLFRSRYWAGHVGGRSTMTKEFERFGLPYRNCSKTSIGVELVSWGGLKMIDNKLYTCYGSEYTEGADVHFDDPFRGYSYFDSYTTEQIATLKELLIYWNKVYDIPLEYKEDMWDVNEQALNNTPGIYSHTSFRRDKSDLFPQKELIEMLKSL